jgi:hypothetical protein
MQSLSHLERGHHGGGVVDHGDRQVQVVLERLHHPLRFLESAGEDSVTNDALQGQAQGTLNVRFHSSEVMAAVLTVTCDAEPSFWGVQCQITLYRRRPLSTNTQCNLSPSTCSEERA